MLLKAKTRLEFDNSWVKQLKFVKHTDQDLAGHVDAISIKSESGSVFDFYRSNPLENPDDFKYTALYDKIPQVKKLVDHFELQTTRVRIHRQLPGQEIPLHTDGNNTTVKNKDDYMIRSITALTGSKDFRYNFIDTENKRRVQWLRQGETILFDPDLVAHGMANESTTETRYALVQIFKLYPVTDWARDFISTEKVVTI
tara:strand:- start:35 stop:631 length:597 start_codon:yes stop_codon:yes gene_type:complete